MLTQAAVLFDERWLLTGRGCFTHKGHQLLFDLLEGVQVVHEEDVSVAGFTGDAHQLTVVGISEAERKHDVTFTGRQREKKCLSSTWKQPEGEREHNMARKKLRRVYCVIHVIYIKNCIMSKDNI